MTSLQGLVDELSERLGRPVLLDDRDLAPVAYSRQWGELDRVRRESILARGVPPAVRTALLAAGIDRARRWMRIAADPSIGLRARVCVPVRAGGEQLGYLWLLDDGLDERIAESALEAAQVAARLLAEQAQRPLRKLLWELVDANAEIAARAAAALAEHGVAMTAAQTICAVSAEPAVAAAVPWLEHGLARLARTCDSGAVLWAPGAVHHLLIVADRDPAWRGRPQRAAVRLHRLLDEDPDRPAGFRPAIGIGDSAGAPVHVARSLRRAQQALRVARAGGAGEVVGWSELGALQLLTHLDATAREDLPPALLLLRAHDPGGTLRRTLERYLDLGGDVRAAAAELGVHRGTLYHRLHRIEELTGCRLGDGEDRLMLHVGLKALGLLDAEPAECTAR